VRTVKGPTDSVVVVGAGLGGLSAALRLAGAGRSVTLLEREAVPGGRAGVLHDSGYTFDTGPTVLTMPDLIADALDCVGERLEDWLQLEPVSPLYRASFADGSRLDVHADPVAMEAEISAVCGPDQAAGYRRYVDFVSRVYRYEMRDFIDTNMDSPLSVLSPNLARLAAIGGFRKLAPKVAEYLTDPRLQRVYSFQAMYAGLSPYDALAIYSVIGYMDSVAGVSFARGGMHAVPQALAGAAEKHGVDIRYSTEVERVELRGRGPLPSTPPTVSASPATRSSSIRTFPWRTATCWGRCLAECAGSPTRRRASCCWPGRRRAMTTWRCTTSPSARPGARSSPT
jgi:phytoene desaturase